VTATFVTVMRIFIRGCFINKLMNMSQLQKFKGISNAQKSQRSIADCSAFARERLVMWEICLQMTL
jgi:hypothetical protein